MTVKGTETGDSTQGDASLTEEQIWAQEVAAAAGDDPAGEGEPTETRDAPGETGAEETTTDETGEQPTATEPAQSPAPAAPSAEERLARIEQMMTQMGSQVASFGGRVSALQRELAQAENARKAMGSAAPTKEQVAEAKKDPEKWKQLKEDIPEWGEAIEELVAARMPAQAPTAAPQQPVDVEAIKAQIKQDLELDLIATKYPDWRAVSQTNEFKNWFNAQPETFRRLGESTRGADVIHVFDEFGKAKARNVTDIRQNRQARLGAAAGVGQQPGRALPAVKREEDLTEQEIWDQEVKRINKLHS